MAESAAAVSAFLGLTAEGWTAIGTVFLATATSIPVAVGVFQIRSIREEESKNRTLEVCDRYDRDAVLDAAFRRIRTGKASGDFAKDPTAYRLDVVTLLNYLDSIACGIEQRLYIEDLARDHIESIVKFHVSQYFGKEAPSMGVDAANYRRLIELEAKWAKTPVRYKRRRLSIWRRDD